MESLLAHIERRERGSLRVKKVDVDEHPELAKRFLIAEVPSLATPRPRPVEPVREGDC